MANQLNEAAIIHVSTPQRPMFIAALAFLGGHCALHALPQLPLAHRWAIVPVFVTAVCLAWLRWRPIRYCAGIVLVGVCGFASAWWQADLRITERWPESRSGTDIELRGFIASIVEAQADGKRFRFDVRFPERDVPDHVELTWYGVDVAPAPGEFWQLRVRLRSPRGFANPGGYDYEAQLLRADTGATGYVREATANRKLAEPHWSYFVLRARASIAANLAVALSDSPMLGIVQGLVVGETSRVTSEQWQVFANTGTTHLMAISGMHIGMVALCMAWLAGFCARRLPLQRYRLGIVGAQAIAGMSAAAAYSALAGFSVPTQRTLIMLCVFFGARFLRREIALTQGLGLALFGVLLVDPFAPLAPGFWLSFGAVGAIFLATGGRIGKAARWREYGRLQIVATLGLMPLLIGAFGNLSLLSPLVNLVAIPFFTVLIVPLLLIATGAMPISAALGSLGLRFAAQLMEWVWPSLEWASRLPFALWPLPELPFWAFALLLIGTVIMLAPGLLATRVAGAMLCAPALLWSPSRPARGEFELSLLDVGQGLSIVIGTATHTLLYDVGPSFRSGRDTGELAVVPYLRARGIRRIDTLVASHGDADHIGGLESVLSRISIDRLLFGPSVPQRAASEVCAAGQSWSWDDVRFEIVYPPTEVRSARRNDSSCVLRIVGIGGSALLLGDVERAAEQQLVAQGSLAPADIVVVPHHGSRTSSTAALVAATRPRYALISAGFGNQWGFPKPDVLERWTAQGAVQLQTAHGGAIEILVARAGVRQPRVYRQRERRYWRK